MWMSGITGLFALQLGLMAGFYYAWSISSMPGFKKAPATVYIQAMQRINEAVLNAWFFACFFGVIPVGIAALLLTWSWLVATALLFYVAGVVTTIAVNVPINNAMAKWDPANPPADWQAVRDRWTRWNHLRGIASTIAFILALIALQRM